MALTAESLAEYVGTTSATDFVQSCWSTAAALITEHIGGSVVPAAVLDRAHLELGAELFHRKSTKNAIAQFAADGTPAVRIARDPMVAVRPLLDPYLEPGIG